MPFCHPARLQGHISALFYLPAPVQGHISALFYPPADSQISNSPLNKGVSQMKINQIGLSRLAAEKIQQTEVLMKTRSFLLAASIMLALAFTFSCDSGGGGDGTGGGSSSSGGPGPGGGSSSSGGGVGGYTGSYGSVSHGGKAYKTVRIGTQTWMAENLNYNVAGSKCYDDLEANCNTYGRLYNWETALEVCPSGWHLPSDDEWTVLEDYVGSTAGTKLKATSGWSSGNGTNSYGFSALPGGIGESGYFSGGGSFGTWWSATENNSNNAY